MGYRTKVNDIIQNVGEVIVGKKEVVEKVLICLLSEGNALLEDVPGVGKTMLIKALAKSLGCDFSRIQFTPDLLPSDITGVNILNPKTGEFEFKFGPIMSNIILADEINRTSPKTQSSLLEAMEEKQVTVDNKTYKLQEPFIVLATQNPIEYEGTFPLLEAQLDRFMMKISIGYPNEDEEIMILRRFKNKNPLFELKEVVKREEILKMQREVKEVYIDDKIERYIVSLVSRTRNREEIIIGASPRASIHLLKASQAKAYINDRDYVTPDDVKQVFIEVISHRIAIKPEIKLRGYSEVKILGEILSEVKVPGAKLYV
ncbi:AAA family ATPase [Caloramator proteoclasticus]|uniref:MoxR-like ATPase n=1 Tax=Caloramator proteoclasticus DSM 10124 TaxID=1121262 RepID=A0A1M4W9Q4_9CLOT|nr:MoxR family ATPase [Caloramator proteoclasticus]SHE77905.1 MoxR-like ATPase [Caloramator proteoclasticus DSM 10124]